MNININHVIALFFLGIGSLILLNTNHVEAGIALIGMLAGYAFKNGMKEKAPKTKTIIAPNQGELTQRASLLDSQTL